MRAGGWRDALRHRKGRASGVARGVGLGGGGQTPRSGDGEAVGKRKSGEKGQQPRVGRGVLNVVGRPCPGELWRLSIPGDLPRPV